MPLHRSGRFGASAAAAALAVAGIISFGAQASAAKASAKSVTLTVLNGDGGETGLLHAYAVLNKKFEQAHPGVKIDFEVKSFDDLIPTLKLTLSGSSGVPDVVQDNQGYSSMGELVTDGLLRNLNSIAAADHWSQRQPASLLALDGRFSSDGKTMGSGPLWGISSTGTWVGLYENTAIAKQLGIKGFPKTLSQLERDMAAAHKQGTVAMSMGTSDGDEALWTIYELTAALSKPQILSTIADGTSSKLPAAMTKAAAVMESWQKAGYFTSGAAGYTATDAFNKFTTGNGLFVVSGSWSVPIQGPPAKTAKFRMTLFPLATPKTLGAVASGDLPWSIPTHAAQPQLAAEYINYITSQAANKAWIDAGQVPASLSGNEVGMAKAAHIKGASLDALSSWVALLKHGYFEPYIDWATPTFLTTETAAVQSLLGGKITPSGYTAALQKDYGAFVKSRHG